MSVLRQFRRLHGSRNDRKKSNTNGSCDGDATQDRDGAKVCAIAQSYLLIAIFVFGLLTVAFMPETILGRRRMLEASRRAGN